MLRKCVRIAAWSLGSLALLIALLYVLVAFLYVGKNWDAKSAWEKYRREREAKGDRFEWSAIVPPPVPDDQNVAMTALFAELFPKPPEHPRLDAVNRIAHHEAEGDWRAGRIESLAGWRAYFTNDDLLAVFEQYQPLLNEVEQSVRQPYCRFPIRYEDNFDVQLLHLGRLRNLARTYRLRALVELSTGQTDAALDDVQTCVRFEEMIKDEPSLISCLVRGAIIGIATQPVWEGLAAHRWNENQLSALQASFQEVDLFDGFVKAMRGERVLQYSGLHRIIEEKERQGLRSLLVRAVPIYWLYQNLLRTDRFFAEEFPSTVDWDQRRFRLASVKAVSLSVEAARQSPPNIPLFITSLDRSVLKSDLAQVIVQQIIVACALERFRVAHGQLPETLDALVPQYLARVPLDVIDSNPLRYRRTAADQFLLYSIGWDERDDDGQIALTSNQPPRLDDMHGDWVWYSQPQPTVSERK